MRSLKSMELNKKVTLYNNLTISVVISLVLVISYLNNWHLETIILSAFFGLAIILFSFLASNYRFFKEVSKLVEPLSIGKESVIVEGKAVHTSGKTKMEGVLYLTNYNLIFESANKEHLKFTLKGINTVRLSSIFGVLPQGIIISNDQHNQYRFVLKYPRDWKKIISFYTEN